MTKKILSDLVGLMVQIIDKCDCEMENDVLDLSYHVKKPSYSYFFTATTPCYIVPMDGDGSWYRRPQSPSGDEPLRMRTLEGPLRWLATPYRVELHTVHT